MPIISEQYGKAFGEYQCGDGLTPLLLLGNANAVLADLPAGSVDCVMTSPPYWGKREYENGGIGQESTGAEYVDALEKVSRQVKRVLKPSGSFWLNLSPCLSTDTDGIRACMGLQVDANLEIEDIMRTLESRMTDANPGENDGLLLHGAFGESSFLGAGPLLAPGSISADRQR